MSPMFDRLWQRVVEDPSDGSRHDKFIAYAVTNNLYFQAIERYKQLEKKGGDLAVIADEQKRKITVRATRKQLDERPVEGGGLFKIIGYLLIAAILVGVGLVAFGVPLPF
jgi:hypothetical protein